jgi:hypothetical protein
VLIAAGAQLATYETGAAQLAAGAAQAVLQPLLQWLWQADLQRGVRTLQQRTRGARQVRTRQPELQPLSQPLLQPAEASGAMNANAATATAAISQGGTSWFPKSRHTA